LAVGSGLCFPVSSPGVVSLFCWLAIPGSFLSPILGSWGVWGLRFSYGRQVPFSCLAWLPLNKTPWLWISLCLLAQLGLGVSVYAYVAFLFCLLSVLSHFHLVSFCLISIFSLSFRYIYLLGAPRSLFPRPATLVKSPHHSSFDFSNECWHHTAIQP